MPRDLATPISAAATSRTWATLPAAPSTRVPVALTGPAALVRTGTSPTSATVPHAWHSPHRPTHFGVTQPHSPQRYAGLGVPLRAVLAAMGRSVGTTPDNAVEAAPAG